MSSKIPRSREIIPIFQTKVIKFTGNKKPQSKIIYFVSPAPMREK